MRLNAPSAPRTSALRVAICGGGLQGVELCRLGKRAGWTVLLLDRRPAPPAQNLADHFILGDIANLDPQTEASLRSVDLIIPATENALALAALVDWCAANDVPLAFDPAAYAVTSSKLRSRELFLACGTPIPTPTPLHELELPLIAKPSGGSGSQGVRLFTAETEFLAAFPQGVQTPEWIFERYCPGPSYSIEVCGLPGAYETFAVTELFMDEIFDCKRVTAPCVLPEGVESALRREAVRLAEALQLRGLMDLEVILTSEGLRVLEIDARFPSQTPTAVLLSSGVNLAEGLAACFVDGLHPSPAFAVPRSCVYEHIWSDGQELHYSGEHIVRAQGPLTLCTDCFGADEILFANTARGWVATLCFVAKEPTAAEVVASVARLPLEPLPLQRP